MKRHIFSAVISVAALLFVQQTMAQQNTLELESTFKGNQEQPKVLYIVPWQSIEAPPASYRPLNTLIEQNFRLLDREEFKRDVLNRSLFQANKEIDIQ